MGEVKTGVNPLFLREEELRQGIEFFLLAHARFAADADGELERQGLGRAHHRVLYFVGRSPDMNVGELTSTLGITKQSLSRVLAELVRRDLVGQRPGLTDRRHKRLRLTPMGEDLERRLTAHQRARIARAYREAGAEAVEGFRKVALGLIDEPQRSRVEAAASRRRA